LVRVTRMLTALSKLRSCQFRKLRLDAILFKHLVNIDVLLRVLIAMALKWAVSISDFFLASMAIT